MAIFASDIQRTILEYYGEDSSIWQRIQTGQATEQEIIQALGAAPQVQPVYSNSGYVLGYDWAEPLANNLDTLLSTVDSNSMGGSYSQGNSFTAQIPANFDNDGGSININSGVKNSLGQTVAAVADKVSLATTGANIGAKLGKAIGTELYNANPQWWYDILPDVGPWFNDVFGQDDLLGKFVRTFLTVDETGTTAYIDERVFASYYQAFMESGMYDEGGSGKSIYPDGQTVPSGWPEYLSTSDIYSTFFHLNYNSDRLYETISSTAKIVSLLRPNGFKQVLIFGRPGDTYRLTTHNQDTGDIKITTRTISKSGVTNNNTPYGYNELWRSTSQIEDETFPIINNNIGGGDDKKITATYIIDGAYESTGGGIEGIKNIDDATQYPPTNITGTTTQEILNQLKQQYPDLFANPITSTVLQPDGSLSTQRYIPIPWVDGLTQTMTQPTTTGKTKEQTQDRNKIEDRTLEQLFPETQPQTQTDGTTPPTTNTPDTGTGNTPTTVLPVGRASSLWAIYNPTQAELNSFGGWLWSSDFVEQLKKLFNDPMQAIIGVHKVFATPITGGSQSIVCGYLDSGVSSKIVTSQYSEIDCGTVNLWEYFGNVFDYSPFTSVKLFLPFIGIVPLDVGFVMRSQISVKYTVDVLTGACLANVHVIRDGVGGVIFSYAGSAIVSYPISSGSYMGVVSGALSIAAGIVGTVASGGAALPAVAGAVSGLSRAHTDVQHSGQFSGAAGAMGGKKPYLIISRPQTRVAGGVQKYKGKPSNSTIRIGECVGFTKILEAHLSIPNAYDTETAEILQLLKEGVII